MNIKIKVKDGAKIPEYQTKGSSGADIHAFLDESIIMSVGMTTLIPTGVFMEIPEGYEAQIRPRSGLALKHGLTILNTPGTIDSDYRGEIKLIVSNFGSEFFVVSNGMRLAQIVFNKVYKGEFIVSENLNSTDRDGGGFGHSGMK